MIDDHKPSYGAIWKVDNIVNKIWSLYFGNHGWREVVEVEGEVNVTLDPLLMFRLILRGL